MTEDRRQRTEVPLRLRRGFNKCVAQRHTTLCPLSSVFCPLARSEVH